MKMRAKAIVIASILSACAACRTSQLREPGEPVDMPLDNIDVAVVEDGGTPDVHQAQPRDGGAELEGAGAGEPEEGLGVDLRDM